MDTTTLARFVEVMVVKQEMLVVQELVVPVEALLSLLVVLPEHIPDQRLVQLEHWAQVVTQLRMALVVLGVEVVVTMVVVEALVLLMAAVEVVPAIPLMPALHTPLGTARVQAM